MDPVSDFGAKGFVNEDDPVSDFGAKGFVNEDEPKLDGVVPKGFFGGELKVNAEDSEALNELPNPNVDVDGVALDGGVAGMVVVDDDDDGIEFR